MATIQIVDDSDETENSVQEIEYDRNVNEFTYLKHYLPLRSPAMGDKSDISDNLISIIPYATLRVKRNQLPVEEHAKAIASHLQLSTKLMQDDPTSERLRLETLRAMPQCLTIKRSVKLQLQATLEQKSKRKSINYWKWLKYKSSFNLMKIRTVIQEVTSTIELWHGSIKNIEGLYGSGIATYFKFLRWLIVLNLMSCILSTAFIVLPQSLYQPSLDSYINGWDILTGSGSLTNTILYYGFYSNDTVENVMGNMYNIPTAYFITLLCCYVLTFIILSAKVILSYQKCYVEIRGKVHNLYSNKIFCGWDFSISSTKAANLQSVSIYRELKELLAETENHTYPSCYAKFLAIVIQIAITAVILAMICGTGMLLWTLLDRHDIDKSNILSIMIVPTLLTIIMYIFPAIISWLTKLERYTSKRTELYVSMIRVHAMATTVIGTLLVFWLINSTHDCWQTELGQEIYRLILFDFIASTVGVCLTEVTRFILRKVIWKKLRKSEFNIARNTLNLLYNQTLFWLGHYFSPLMSFIIIVKMILIFYVKKYGLLKYYKPPSRPWRAAQTQTLFLALAFLGMIGVLITLGYVITNVQSNECGPFRGYFYTWDFIVQGVLALEKDSVFWRIVSELTRPAVGAAILIGMGIGVYCLRAKAEASKELLHILRQMLILQSKDKEFLLKSFTKVADRELSEQNIILPSVDRGDAQRVNSESEPSESSSEKPRRRNVTLISHCQDDYV